MESIRLDHVIRPPGLDGAKPRAAKSPLPEAQAQTPESAIRGPKRATSSDRVDPLASSDVPPARNTDGSATDPEQQIHDAIESLQENVQGLSKQSLQIRYSEEHSRFVVKVLDADTGEVVRELPPEQLLDAATRIDEVRGLLFDEKS